ncbi:MAG: sigma-70 family RNA polymerase sigma factor [Oscillospiraceae bacterium]|nr:sigma-70 family RNA polymerase sigma factor [Oscillospiraceae bacterium]
MEYPWEEFETEYSYLAELVLDEEPESQDEKLWDEESMFRLETQWEPTEEEDANAVDETADPVVRYLGDVLENPNDPDSPISMATLLEQLEETSVERMTEAARTQEEFEILLKEWDRLDRNRERRERYHEILKSEYCQENHDGYSGRIFPTSLDTAESKLLFSGDFLDLIYDCPYEMHSLLANPVLSSMVENLSDIQKETLYFLSLQFVSTVRLACMRGQSDRNIRKLRDTYTQKLQRQLYAYLKEKKTAGQSLSSREKEFLMLYEASLKENGSAAKVRKENKYPKRKRLPDTASREAEIGVAI